jgi:hypothetical protein
MIAAWLATTAKTDLKEHIYCVRIGTYRVSLNLVELFR